MVGRFPRLFFHRRGFPFVWIPVIIEMLQKNILEPAAFWPQEAARSSAIWLHIYAFLYQNADDISEF